MSLHVYKWMKSSILELGGVLVIIYCNWVCVEFVCEPVLLQHRPLCFWVWGWSHWVPLHFQALSVGNCLPRTDVSQSDSFSGGNLRVLIELFAFFWRAVVQALLSEPSTAGTCASLFLRVIPFLRVDSRENGRKTAAGGKASYAVPLLLENIHQP